MKTTTFIIVILLGLLLSPACKKDGQDTSTIASECPITDADFDKVPPPSFQQLYNAQIDVLRADSTLVHKEQELFCAVFDWAKRHPNGQLKRTSGIEDYFTAFKLHQLNPEEWQLIRRNPFKGLMAGIATVEADRSIWETYPCDEAENFYNTKADAYHHAVWSMMIARSTSPAFSKTFTDLHELHPIDAAQTAMDLHNNKVGRDLVAKYPNAIEKELLAILSQQRYVFLKDPRAPIPSIYDNDLVYFDGQRTYDGNFGGTITNPDSGGPWDIVLYLNQCGNVMRGKFLLFRGNERQERRFSGTLASNGIMNLNVADPYVYENPTGSFCSGYQMRLSASPFSLTGSWTSTNCSQGGTLNLWR